MKKTGYEQVKQIHPLCAFSCWHVTRTDSPKSQILIVPGMAIQGCRITLSILLPHPVWMAEDKGVCVSPTPSAAPLEPKSKGQGKCRKLPAMPGSPGSGEGRAEDLAHLDRASLLLFVTESPAAAQRGK